MNNTIKNDIKTMLQYATTQSELTYIQLLNDLTTIQDLEETFNLTTKQVITITNELEKDFHEPIKTKKITLKHNELDRMFLENTIEDWRDDKECKASQEYRTIRKMLKKGLYNKWEQIFTQTIIKNEELGNDFEEAFKTIQDYDSEIIIEEYFDSVITLYEETRGLFICEEEKGKDNSFRITLYKLGE
jgi:hypothetical protein